MSPKKHIALFDFDGTITKKDTLVHLIWRHFGLLPFALRVTPLIGHMVLYKLGVLTNQAVKQNLFSRFFGGMNVSRFEEICRSYSLNVVDEIVRSEARVRIEWHRARGDSLVIVSASVENWIRPWAEREGFEDVLATTVDIQEGRLTGRFASRNCYGAEKVARFLEWCPNRSESYVHAYGNSRGDREMLAIADEAHYRCF